MSPSSSSVLARAAQLPAWPVHCTLVQWLGLYNCAGAGTGAAASDQSGYSDRVEHTVTASVTTQCYYRVRERESCPGLCTPTCASPSVLRANVRAPSACTDSQDHKLEVKIGGKPFPLVTEDQVKLRLNPAKHLKLNQ